MKVLVVEDSQTILPYLSAAIREMGLECLSAADGAAGLAAYRDGRPDCVLLDVELPDTSGFDVARAIRADEAERGGGWTPIIFLTGLANDASLAAGIDAGGDDYLVKPVSQVVLAAKINAMQRIK